MAKNPRQRRRTTPLNNIDVVAAEVRRTMSVVGIGRRYYDARFYEFPGGGELMNKLLSMWTPENIRRGYGITVVGPSKNAGHLHMMLARALHLSGTGVVMVGLQGLAQRLQDTGEEDVVVERVGALFIRRFMEGKKCPLRPYEVALVEELVDRRVANNLAVFPWMAGTPQEPWWSDHVLEQLAEPRNVDFEVPA